MLLIVRKSRFGLFLLQLFWNSLSSILKHIIQGTKVHPNTGAEIEIELGKNQFYSSLFTASICVNNRNISNK